MAVGWYMGVCYEDDGMTGSRNQEWLQGTINVIIVLFRRVGLMENIEKSKTMTYQPGEIRMGMSDKDFSLRSKVEGGTYRERLRLCIPCPDCKMELTAGSMPSHHRQFHGT